MPGILPMKVIKVGSSSQSRIAQACDRYVGRTRPLPRVLMLHADVEARRLDATEFDLVVRNVPALVSSARPATS
ncbi:hypothetical protein KCV04_g17464, partial [Aureobasidium melanogenum]